MDLNKCFSRKVCMKVLRVVNSFVLLIALICLIIGFFFRANPDKTPPTDSKRKPTVNQAVALTITHAVFLLVCSIAGIVTSVKPRLLVGTFYATLLMFLIISEIILTALSQTSLKKTLDDWAENSNIVYASRCLELSHSECKDLINSATRKLCNSLTITTAVAAFLNFIAGVFVYRLIGLSTREEVFPVDNKYKRNYMTPAEEAVQYGKVPTINIQKATSSEETTRHGQNKFKDLFQMSAPIQQGGSVVTIEYNNNGNTSSRDKGLKRKTPETDVTTLKPRAIHFSTISSEKSLSVTPAQPKANTKVISTKVKKRSPPGRKFQCLERPAVPIEKSLSPVKSLIRRLSSPNVGNKYDTPTKCSFCGAYRRSILKGKGPIRTRICPPPNKIRKGSITWMDSTSPVPDTHRCCIQCGKITPEMERRSPKFSLVKTPTARKKLTCKRDTSLRGEKNRGFSPGSDGMQSPRSNQSEEDEVFSPMQEVENEYLCSDIDYSTPGNTINFAYIQSPSVTQEQLVTPHYSNNSGDKSAGSTPYRVLQNSSIELHIDGTELDRCVETPDSYSSLQFISGTVDNKLFDSTSTTKTVKKESSYLPMRMGDTPDFYNSRDTITFL